MLRDLKIGSFQFGTKAETLSRIEPHIKMSVVPRFEIVSVEHWHVSQDAILPELREKFVGQQIAVRSSARGEDNPHQSLAGKYTSVLEVDGGDGREIGRAIEKVIDNYPGGRKACSSSHQVLIQQMVTDVSMSGVVFTQDLNTGAPYYVINYDDVSGRTDTVTSGGDQGNHTLYVHRGSTEMLHSSRFIAVIKAVQEIEAISNSSVLDIEFAVGRDDQVFFLQVRRITTQPNWNRGIEMRVNDMIERMAELGAKRFAPAAGVYGKTSLFGQMPDWNPVEMIGSRPRPLAASLYQRLITEKAWRLARRRMGYAEPRGEALMYMFGGQPYIDVRLSFHSFLPTNLPSQIADKLVTGWIERLKKLPHLHDKIEFDVAITTLDFNFDEEFDVQCEGLLSDSERDIFRWSLQELTANLLSERVAGIDAQLEKIELLEAARAELLSASMTPSLSTVSALLEDCVELGTIPFSILARYGFIAQSFLNSLVARGIFSPEDKERFRATTKTVASEFVEHIDDVFEKKMQPDEFLERYGHLRPGTYDILSLRYDQRPELFEGLERTRPLKRVKKHQGDKFNLTGKQRRLIEGLLSEYNYTLTPDDLLRYIVRSTEAREYAKFLFTRNLSDILEIIAHLGEQNGLSRDELSFIPIDVILSTHVTTKGRNIEEYLRGVANAERQEHQVTSAIQLPHLIGEVNDFHVVPLLLSRPNFITTKAVLGDVVCLSGHDMDQRITDKIVAIESADPGFDWIFTRKIAGLITKFGGANSHMAIRCAEFGIPAAIGCGEQIFQRALNATSIELDCAQGLVNFSE